MARKSSSTTSFLATIPLIAGILVGLLSASWQFYALGTDILKQEQILKIKDFLANPLSAATIAVYGSVILSITTVILFMLVRSARTSDKFESRSEPSPDAPGDQPEPALPLSTAEKAARERDRHLTSIRVAFTRNRRRMTEESERLQRNGFLNLMIGILFSVIALGILGYPLFSSNPVQITDWLTLFERFAPRLSVGILIQLIGFFFLRLYVAGEYEVHYIRNEITNLESRLIGYHAAGAGKDTTAMRDLIRQLVRTERNFKLKKGERSLYSTDETFNDVRQFLKDVTNAVPVPTKAPAKRKADLT